MSYTAPTLRSTGDLITGAIYNTDIISNIIAMYAGSMSVPSQAPLDFLYASSASQLARLAALAGAVPLVTAAGSAWEMHRLALVPALANALNSAAKVAIVTVPVLANELTDGSVLTVTVAVLVKNNKGTSGTITFGVAYDAGEVSPVEGAIPWGNDATEYPVLWRFTAMRVGADLWVATSSATAAGGDPGGQLDLMPGYTPVFLSAGSTTPNVRKIVAPSFTTNKSLLLNITLSAADANFYVKPQSAHVRRYSL